MFKEARRIKNITQQQLADMLKVTQGQIANWETERFPIPEHHRIELQKILHIHIEPHVNVPRGPKRKGHGAKISTSFLLTEKQWINLKNKAKSAGMTQLELVVKTLGLDD